MRIFQQKLKTVDYDTDAEQHGISHRSKLQSETVPRGYMHLRWSELEEKLPQKWTHLSRAVSSGDLEAADSKTMFLQSLCIELHFDPEKASDIHKDIYHQKLQQAVANGELSEEGSSPLLCLRVLLCIPQKTVEAAHVDICGSLVEKVVRDEIATRVEGYDADMRASMRKAARCLCRTKDAAIDIASKTSKVLMWKSQLSRPKLRKKSGNSFSLQTLRKTRPNKKLEAKLGKQSQTEILLKDDLPLRDRTDLYKTYLMYCITGEVTKIPFGAQITTKDNSEYLLLNQLGAILGLAIKETVEMHRNLAEQAFRRQAEVILADGQLTKARIDQLNEVQGRLSIKQIRELKEASVDLDTMVSESLRENLFKKTIDEVFSSGTGDLDEEEGYMKIPSDLNINIEKAKGVVHELAKTRLANSLIQAVALLRQRNRIGVVWAQLVFN
ncbi:hypothetical protein FRX31_029563 [Thalictrum thalictroides]|uniref:Uncharacterized protein n=1 Tax=Thalictrum thalictroides TaxID=46969 RepID=A0A7J6V8Z1_THATH|nr:hypothetical protein FRX31_029563 [Thalictrum thalictroides]